MNPWFVYMMQCRDGTYYTGITTDLTRRQAEHNGEGGPQKGAKYTQVRRPVVLVYSETVESRSAAQRREYVVRQLSRLAKETLIQNQRQNQ